MPVIVVTRLRLKDPALLDAFFAEAVAAIEQAQKSEGILGVDALADADNAWWTVTAWRERRLMHAYAGSEPHQSIRTHLDHFCDEATFVDWEQDSPDLPDWQTNWRHLVADGTAGELTSPSAAHQARDFPVPVEAAPSPGAPPADSPPA
jgi:quinol monooxygenase YgiN